MAERRMFAKMIIDSDAFLDMPLSTQALYFHLSMRADDEGFINNANKIMRVVGASKNDMDLLLVKGFIIPFNNGICVIKHWLIHNYIQKDRFKETSYTEERSKLTLKDNKSYSLKKGVDTPCIQDVYGLDSQYSIGKDSIELGKDSLGDICGEVDEQPAPPEPVVEKTVSVFINLPLIDKSEFAVTEEFVKELEALYLAVDVETEIRKMKGWLISNPKNRKTIQGIRKFITGWLCREQDRAKISNHTIPAVEAKSKRDAENSKNLIDYESLG